MVCPEGVLVLPRSPCPTESITIYIVALGADLQSGKEFTDPSSLSQQTVAQGSAARHTHPCSRANWIRQSLPQAMAERDDSARLARLTLVLHNASHPTKNLLPRRQSGPRASAPIRRSGNQSRYMKNAEILVLLERC